MRMKFLKRIRTLMNNENSMRDVLGHSLLVDTHDARMSMFFCAYDPFEDGTDFTMKKCIPQSITFAKEMLPQIYKTICSYVEGDQQPKRLSIADVGGGVGAGSEYIRARLQMRFLDTQVYMAIIEINGRYREWCNHFSPKISFLCEDIFRHEGIYDYIICSHTVEHVTSPSIFIRRIQQLARKNVFVYAPYMEQPLPQEAGHISTVDDTLIDQLNPLEKIYINSEGYSQKECVLLVLPGCANDIS